jgi:hypothetical protein
VRENGGEEIGGSSYWSFGKGKLAGAESSRRGKLQTNRQQTIDECGQQRHAKPLRAPICLPGRPQAKTDIAARPAVCPHGALREDA